MRDQGLRRWLVLPILGGLALTGIALARVDGGGTAEHTGTGHPVATVPAGSTVAIDWSKPTHIDLGNGWAVTDTEGDAPMITVLRHGREVGIVEHLEYPLETAGDDVRVALDTHVADFLKAIGDDRAGAPIKGYRFVPDPAVHLSAADGTIVRYGFRGTLPDGRPSERTIQWAGIRDGRLVLVAASAYDEGGLFSPEGSEFTSADLDAVASRLDRLVRASGLPAPSAR